MDDYEATGLDADARNDLLGRGGTGVVSLADGDHPPYSVPVSYGFDAETEAFFFRLATGPGGEKGTLDGRGVSFVVYDTVDGVWQSVVARGHLEPTTEESIAIETLEALERVWIPLVDVFGRPTEEVTFEFFRLDPETLTARQESSTRP